ncbi:pentapeptide repeat-containing protein [Streptosporangium canum]|nr:pentapeptide repeat-containing protein [Streptosporangium canum]
MSDLPDNDHVASGRMWAAGGWNGGMPLLPRRPSSRADVPVVAVGVVVPPQLRTPRPAAWWIVPVTLLVGGVTGGLAWLLLAAGWSAAEATARQGAIQTALAAGAGVGAAVTLMLAFRRQRHQEHAAHVTAYLAERNAALAEQVADNTKHDATERRVTDLYTKAVEQLGHGKAAVRLEGRRRRTSGPPHRPTHPHRPSRDDRPANQRSTLPAAPTFWEGVRLDLTGAPLIDFDLTDGHVTDARFDGATFTGTARFDGATFTGNTWFGGATFAKGAWFEKVTFTEHAGFARAALPTGGRRHDGAAPRRPRASRTWPAHPTGATAPTFRHPAPPAPGRRSRAPGPRP